MGGGRQLFYPNSTYNLQRDEKTCRRGDEKDLVRKWEDSMKTSNKKSKYVTTTAQLQEAMTRKPDSLLGKIWMLN
jgi:alkaline phosphatase